MCIRDSFGSAGAVGIPAYLLTRGTLGNTGAMSLMLVIMLPAFLLAMYEKDGWPFEKGVRNIIRAKCLRPGIRAYRTENIYAPFAGQLCIRDRDIINLTQNLDCYGFYPGVSDEETLGRIYVDDLERLDVPDQVKPYFDYEA